MFDKTFELALAAEAGDRNSKDLQSTKLLAVLVSCLNHHQQKMCNHCEENQCVADCCFKLAECYKCGKRDIYLVVVEVKLHLRRSPTYNVPCSTTHVLTEDSGDYSMYNIIGSHVQPFKVTVIVNSANLEKDVNTGASSSLIIEQADKQLYLQD